MARRPRRGEHENHDRWLISYADFITLLFAFFVVMYAVSSVNEGKYKLLSSSLGSAFGDSGIAKPDVILPQNENELSLKSMVERRDARLAEGQRKQQEYMRAVAKNLNHVLAPAVSSGQINITQTKRGVELDINASALFNQGEAELRGDSIKVLGDVVPILKQGDQIIEVEGHTDNIPIKNQRFPSNWELSSARASSVVRLFIEHGVAATRLTAVGSADNHPILPNSTPEGRARNRRVTVTILAPTEDNIQKISGRKMEGE